MSERPNITTAKAKQRDQINRDTEEFLRSGGTIKQVPSTHRGFESEIAFFLGPERDRRIRKAKALR